MLVPPSPKPARLRVRDLQSDLAGPYTFNLEAGHCLVISGPSGAGKSLLLRMLCDLDPSDGEVLLDGVPREHMSAPDWRARVLYQPAEAAWWLATAGAHFKPSQLPQVHALLPQLQLSATLLESDISRLSTGERQRMALLRSLVCQPQVLLLDEPTAALDPAAVAAVELLLQQQLAAGLAIILVTHSAAQAQKLGHQHLTLAPRQLNNNRTPA